MSVYIRHFHPRPRRSGFIIGTGSRGMSETGWIRVATWPDEGNEDQVLVFRDSKAAVDWLKRNVNADTLIADDEAEFLRATKETVLIENVKFRAQVTVTKSIEELIAASSLGTPETVAIRSSSDPEQVADVMRRVAELEVTRLRRLNGAWAESAIATLREHDKEKARADAAERELAPLRAFQQRHGITLEMIEAPNMVWVDAAVYSRIQIERDDARGELAGLKTKFAEVQEERDALHCELERWRHGVTVEGDFVCPDSLALAEMTKRVEEADEAYDKGRTDGEDWAWKRCLYKNPPCDGERCAPGVVAERNAAIARAEAAEAKLREAGFLNPEAAARLEAALDDPSGPTPAMIELFREPETKP